jgi:hypothetical protein
VVAPLQYADDLRRFFDYYFKGVANGWREMPRVRFAVLDSGETAGIRRRSMKNRSDRCHRHFALLNTTLPGLVFLAVILSLIPHSMMYGPQAALIAESFTGRLRYSGASLGYQLASIIAGGPAPLVAAWLFAQYRSGYSIAAYILLCATLSLISTAMLRDYTNRDISQEYARTLREGPAG